MLKVAVEAGAAGDRLADLEWVVAEVELMEDWETRQTVRTGDRIVGWARLPIDPMGGQTPVWIAPELRRKTPGRPMMNCASIPEWRTE
jgi:hypothetical protein